MAENKNNFKKSVKMHLACKPDPLRPAYGYIQFKDGFAYASDGHIAVKNRIEEISGLNPAEIEALDGKFLQSEFYRDMLKYEEILIAEDGIECKNGEDRVFFYFSTVENPIDIKKVIDEHLTMPERSVETISLNMKYLMDLSKAMYECESCTFTFHGEGRGVVLKSNDEDVNSVGLIMPIFIQ